MSRFTYVPEIKPKDIDAFGHVNNEVYLRWLLEAATAHSDSLGYSTAKFVELGAGFVVRRHELDYLLPVFLKDEIRVETWSEFFEGAAGFRNYVIINVKNERKILTAKSKFVFVDLKSGRPMAIPEAIMRAFGHA